MGDRVSIGDVDLVVCALDDAGGVGTVGIVIGEEDPGAGALVADLLRRAGARLGTFFRRPKIAVTSSGESSPSKDIGGQP